MVLLALIESQKCVNLGDVVRVREELPAYASRMGAGGGAKSMGATRVQKDVQCIARRMEEAEDVKV